VAVTELISRMYLKVHGSYVSAEVMDSVISMEVDDTLSLPDMFSIHLRDPDMKWVDSETFALGKTVAVSASNAGKELKLMSGEITAIEPRFTAGYGPTVVVRGYDRSHRLNRDRKTRSFMQMTDSDIAVKIAREAGLATNVDATRQVHTHILQDNTTDWEFLTGQAYRIGYRVYVEDATLHFLEAPSSGSQKPVVHWGVDLTQFNARMSTGLQVSEVVVQGWDPGTQKQIRGSATVPRDVPLIGEKRQGGQASKQAFGIPGRRIIVDRPVSNQAEADALAQAVCDEIGQGFVEAECVCFGNPSVQAGTLLRIEGVGSRFSGTYRVTHALHRYDISGYNTHFKVGGHHSSTLSELLTPAGSERRTVHSPALGVITNNDDPERLGRVKVKLPSLTDKHDSNWARLVTIGAGNERGVAWIPDVGDEALVVFEQGDINRPLVIGCLWNRKAPPPEASTLVASGKAAAIRIDTHDRQASLKSGDELTADGKKVFINAETDLELRSGGGLKIEAKGDVQINGKTIRLN
jgi:phage protein D/phage baseplate assembly protein gpV